MIYRPRFTDPIGPGTAAWNAFDNALEAWRNTAIHDQRRDRSYKRFYNRRQHMIVNLRKHGGDVEGWCKTLRERCLAGDWADV